jgi:hypothetical protein
MYDTTAFHTSLYFSIVLPSWPTFNGFSLVAPPTSRRWM